MEAPGEVYPVTPLATGVPVDPDPLWIGIQKRGKGP